MAVRMPQFLVTMDPKRRQYVYLAVAAVVFITAYILVNIFIGGGPTPPQDAPVAAATKQNTRSLTHRPGQQISDRETWIGGAARDVETLKRSSAESERRQDQFNRDLLRRLEQIENKATRGASANPAASAQAGADTSGAPPAPPPRALPPPLAGGAAPNGALRSYPPGTPGGVGVAVGHGPAAGGVPSSGMVRVQLNANEPTANATGSRNANAEARKEIPKVGTTLPVSFVRATMLSGVDAPTGATAQRHPLPVLLRLDDLAVLPNDFRSDIKGCFVIGEASGSLSSERAYIRAIRLSCTTVRGEIVEVDFIGAVHGPDGKVGVRGRLVTKQGALLGKALLAGLAGGIAQGFAAQNVTYSVSPLGSVGTIDPSDVFKNGAYNGISQAMTELARFYTASAKEMYPIIEVDAGTSVDIVVTQKVNFASALPATRPEDGAPAKRTSGRMALAGQINTLNPQEE